MYISQVSGERLQDHWSSGIRTILPSSMLCENKRKKFESTNMNLAHFKILFFSNFSSMGVGLKKNRKILSSTPSCKFYYAFDPK